MIFKDCWVFFVDVHGDITDATFKKKKHDKNCSLSWNSIEMISGNLMKSADR